MRNSWIIITSSSIMYASVNLSRANSIISDDSFHTVNEDYKPRTVNFSPRYTNSKFNDSVTTFGGASIFERDVETNSIFTMSNSSLNSLPNHYKNENFIPAALTATTEALTKEKNIRNIDVVYPNGNRPSDVLLNSLGKSPKRHDSVTRRNTNMSVEDLVRNRKNSTVSFCAYSDYLEEEANTDMPYKNAFQEPDNVTRHSSISKLLKSSGLSAPPAVKKGSPMKSLYKQSNSSNVSLIEELKFKNMMVRKMSNLDDTLAIPNIPETPSASPIALGNAYDPNSALSSPIRLEDDMDIDDPLNDTSVVEFESVLDSAFVYNTSSIMVQSMDDLLRQQSKQIMLDNKQ